MKIKELNLTHFGKFTDRSYQLGSGLNLFYGSNESGKTTTHMFLQGMLFGMERGRGRAAVYDNFSLYAPWDNPNHYTGSMTFESAGKTFHLNRNFDRYSKKAELVCLDDGERMSVEDGDLMMLLGGMEKGVFQNTISVAQDGDAPEKFLETQLKNYASDYFFAGKGGVNMDVALDLLEKKRKTLNKQMEAIHQERRKEKEVLEQEASYVWREIHYLEQELDRTEELRLAQEKLQQEEEQKKKESVGENKKVDFFGRSFRINPFFIPLWIAAFVCSFLFIPKMWNYPISILLLIGGLCYVWNHLKVAKNPEKTDSELMLEEISSREEFIPMTRISWELEHISKDLQEKQVEYGNIREQLGEMQELGEVYTGYQAEEKAISLAIERLRTLSVDLQKQLKESIDQNSSEILRQITGGKYTNMFVEENLHVNLLENGMLVAEEQVSRGTRAQIWLALRLAADSILLEEEMPLILDDAFVFYDEERLANTLRWLEATGRQVLIFTCQGREQEIMEKNGINFNEIIIG
ncbi:MAG: AAA family ATPase [Dorea sp.]|nr:AAA family ATPase [Dorea sp.]